MCCEATILDQYQMTKEFEEMIEIENETNGSSLIFSSDLINPTMQFEGMFVGLLLTYIFGTT